MSLKYEQNMNARVVAVISELHNIYAVVSGILNSLLWAPAFPL